MEPIGYHTRKITKGELGRVSKIYEELQEYEDAEEQGIHIMKLVELSDVYGALESLAEANGTTMKDLKEMSDVTKRAFRNGRR